MRFNLDRLLIQINGQKIMLGGLQPPQIPLLLRGGCRPLALPALGGLAPPQTSAFMRGGSAPSRSPFKKKKKPSPQAFPHRDPSLQANPSSSLGTYLERCAAKF